MNCASQKGRPSQLTLSPSDSQLGANVKAVSGDVTSTGGDDRDVMSEARPSFSPIPPHTLHPDTNYASTYTGRDVRNQTPTLYQVHQEPTALRLRRLDAL